MAELSNADWQTLESELDRVEKQGGTVEDVLKSLGEPNFFKDNTAGPIFVVGMLYVFRDLFQHDLWVRLAKSDQDGFTKELERVLQLARKLMRSYYSVDRPAHRPVVNAGRDKEIFDLKQQKKTRALASLGRKKGMTRTAAAQAYKRQKEKERQRLQAFKAFILLGRPVT